MLLDSSYTIIPQIRFKLSFDNDVVKTVTIKHNDTISCMYKKNGEKFSITGVVTKIGCNFNSSLGAVGTTAFLQIDGSSEFSGQIIYVQPSQILDVNVISTTDVTENIVCSVSNEDQRITLVRENEVGVFQYSLDGVTWRPAVGAQGMSAYECAVALGYEGTEAEWLTSLIGPKGDPGEAGALEIYKVYHSVEEAECKRSEVPKGKLIAIVLDDTFLFVRKEDESGCHCGCGCFIDDDGNTDPISVKGYDYLGSLTVGPQGPPGEPGKSAYEYAVEGGYPGTEEEFIQTLGKSAVAVTSFVLDKDPTLENTVIGPIDLKIFGFTDVETFKSVSLERIDIYSLIREINQSLIFPEPIILRAVPTTNMAAKPNLVIDGKYYVADCITSFNGKIGVLRRVRYIESYSGETIISDWISSTGELDYGAQVQFVSHRYFEEFTKEIQTQYRKLHTYDGITTIETTESTYISIVYPIDIKKFVDNYVVTYIETHKREIVEPIVRELIDLPEGETIASYVTNRITEVVGDLPEGETVTSYVTNQIKEVVDIPEGETVSSYVTNEIKEIVGEFPEEYTTVANYISATTEFQDGFVTTVDIGAVPAGTVINSRDKLIDLIINAIHPTTPTETVSVYVGATEEIPTDISGLTEEVIGTAGIMYDKYEHSYTSDDDYLVYVAPKYLGELISIQDANNIETIGVWSHVEYEDYYIYYTNESLTVEDYKFIFYYR